MTRQILVFALVVVLALFMAGCSDVNRTLGDELTSQSNLFCLRSQQTRWTGLPAAGPADGGYVDWTDNRGSDTQIRPLARSRVSASTVTKPRHSISAAGDHASQLNVQPPSSL